MGIKCVLSNYASGADIGCFVETIVLILCCLDSVLFQRMAKGVGNGGYRKQVISVITLLIEQLDYIRCPVPRYSPVKLCHICVILH